MKYFVWILSLVFLILTASCNLLNPTANQATVEASNQYGGGCPVIVNLDGSNTVTISNGTFYTFPLVSSGSHTLNFSTNGNGGNSSNCVFSNNGQSSYSTTFNTTSGNVYVGTVKENGSTAYQLTESGP